MKKYVKILALVLVVMMALSACGSHTRKGKEVYYAKSAVVSTLDYTHNYVGFTDLHGEEWFWWCDVSTAPWALDDEVLLVMRNNASAYAYDDVIISITTEGIICETITQ